jgi:hypothetical protein
MAAWQLPKLSKLVMESSMARLKFNASHFNHDGVTYTTLRRPLVLTDEKIVCPDSLPPQSFHSATPATSH